MLDTSRKRNPGEKLMNASEKIGSTFWLSPEVTGIIELYAQKAGVSNSVAVEQIISQCSKMMVTGVVEEVTQKDVFEDINRELKAINDRLKTIEDSTDKIYEATVY